MFLKQQIRWLKLEKERKMISSTIVAYLSDWCEVEECMCKKITRGKH